MKFRLFGIPIEIAASFWLATVVLAYARLERPATFLVWAGVLFVGVLVHELGHALAAKAFGQSVRVDLHAMGGTATYRPQPSAHGFGAGEPTKLQTVIISLAGPFAGFALGGVVYAVNRTMTLSHPLATLAVRDALWVNWGYGVLNLLPILPLDGGNVMRMIVDAISGRKNELAATVISVVVAVGLLITSLVMDFRPGLFLLGWIAITQAQRAQQLWGKGRSSEN